MTNRENKKWIWHNSGAIVTTVHALLTFKNPSKQSVAIKAKFQEQERKYKCMYLLENVPFTNKPLNTWPLDKILLISPCSELCNLHKQQKESTDTKDKKKKINILADCLVCFTAVLCVITRHSSLQREERCVTTQRMAAEQTTDSHASL